MYPMNSMLISILHFPLKFPYSSEYFHAPLKFYGSFRNIKHRRQQRPTFEAAGAHCFQAGKRGIKRMMLLTTIAMTRINWECQLFCFFMCNYAKL